MIDDAIPPAKIARVLELHDEGRAVVHIAKLTHVCTSDVAQLLREHCKDHDHGRSASSGKGART